MSEQFNADLDIVQAAPIELELLNGNLNVIQQLDDEPNDVGGLTSAQLKAKFDQAGNMIKQYINERLIPAILASDATEVARINAEAAREQAEAARNTWEIWDSAKPYLPLQKVSRHGNSYICTAACTGIDPAADVSGSGEGTHWLLIAAQGDQGPQGEQGEPGQAGPGVPAGGAQGQILKKASAADFDTEWADEAQNPDNIFKSMRVGDVYHSYRGDIETVSGGKLISMNGRSVSVSTVLHDAFRNVPKLNARIAPPTVRNVPGSWSINRGDIWKVGSRYFWRGDRFANLFYTSNLTTSMPPTSITTSSTEVNSPAVTATNAFLIVAYSQDADNNAVRIYVYNAGGHFQRTVNIPSGFNGGSCYAASDALGNVVLLLSSADGVIKAFHSNDGFATYTQLQFNGSTQPANGTLLQLITPGSADPSDHCLVCFRDNFYIAIASGEKVQFLQASVDNSGALSDFVTVMQFEGSGASYPGYGCLYNDQTAGVFVYYADEEDMQFLRFKRNSADNFDVLSSDYPGGVIYGGAVVTNSTNGFEDVLWFFDNGECERIRSAIDSGHFISRTIITFTSEKGAWAADKSFAGGMFLIDNSDDNSLLLLPGQTAKPTYTDSTSNAVGLLVLDLKDYNYVLITVPINDTDSMGIVQASAINIYIVAGYRGSSSSENYECGSYTLRINYRQIPEEPNAYIKVKE